MYGADVWGNSLRTFVFVLFFLCHPRVTLVWSPLTTSGQVTEIAYSLPVSGTHTENILIPN